jgi:hypothetical protein
MEFGSMYSKMVALLVFLTNIISCLILLKFNHVRIKLSINNCSNTYSN